MEFFVISIFPSFIINKFWLHRSHRITNNQLTFWFFHFSLSILLNLLLSPKINSVWARLDQIHWSEQNLSQSLREQSVVEVAEEYEAQDHMKAYCQRIMQWCQQLVRILIYQDVTSNRCLITLSFHFRFISNWSCRSCSGAFFCSWSTSLFPSSWRSTWWKILQLWLETRTWPMDL